MVTTASVLNAFYGRSWSTYTNMEKLQETYTLSKHTWCSHIFSKHKTPPPSLAFSFDIWRTAILITVYSKIVLHELWLNDTAWHFCCDDFCTKWKTKKKICYRFVLVKLEGTMNNSSLSHQSKIWIPLLFVCLVWQYVKKKKLCFHELQK